MVNILVLCSCFNRRQQTIKAIKSLKNYSSKNIKLFFVIVDDGSTDGTSNILKKIYPDIRVERTSGHFYWAGSMRAGYQKYWDEKKYQFLLVFNDDCIFKKNAVVNLHEVFKSSNIMENDKNKGVVVVGSLVNNFGEVTYGGVCKSRKILHFNKIQPNRFVQEADTLNMNLALIDSRALKINKFMEDGYVHGYADYDFGLSVKRNGGKIFVAPGNFGYCEKNSKKNTWEDESLGFFDRLKNVFSPKGMPPRQRWIFLRRNTSLAFAILLFPYPYLRIIIKLFLS